MTRWLPLTALSLCFFATIAVPQETATETPADPAASTAEPAPATSTPATEAPIDTATDTDAAPSVTPMVTAEFSEESVVVGQANVLRISVLVPTWMPSPPVFPSMDLPNVIVRLPERASGPISETVEGETWSGVSRAYRLYPMVPGQVALPAQSIGITFADPDTTQPVSVEIDLPAQGFTATVPAGAEDLDPMVLASGLSLEQTIDAPEGTLGEGDAVVRTVVARISGTSPLFIPPLIPDLSAEPVQTYAKDPKVTESENRGDLSGTRTDSVTYVARYGGTVDLPAISVEWFNVDSGKVETVSVDGVTLEIDAPEPPREPLVSKRQIFVLCLGAVLLVAVLWLLRKFALPPARAWIEARYAAHLASEAHAAAEVRKAIRSRNLQASTNALATWSTRIGGPSGLSEPLEQALASVGHAEYGTEPGVTVGKGAWKAIEAAFDAERQARLARADAVTGGLPPLNPS